MKTLETKYAEAIDALKSIAELSTDPAGSRFTLRELFGTFQHGTGKPEIEGKRALEVIADSLSTEV